jgi:hypothetical protein
MLEYSSSNSKIEHQFDFAMSTPLLTCFEKLGSSFHTSFTTVIPLKSNSDK